MPKSYEMTPVGTPDAGRENPAFSREAMELSSGKLPNGDHRKETHFSASGDEDESKKYQEENLVEDDFDNLPAPENPNVFARFTALVAEKLGRFWKRFRKIIIVAFVTILACAYFAYFGYAMYVEKLKNENSIRLLWMTCAVTAFVIIYLLRRAFGDQVSGWCGANVGEKWRDLNERQNNRPRNILLGIFVVLTIIAIIVILVVLVGMKDPYNLVSLAGIAFLILFGFVFSKHPDRIDWRPVLVGLLMQLVFALLILKTRPGYEVFKFLGDRVTEFLDHTAAGAKFVFDAPGLPLASFAFTVLPIVIFFSTIVSVLYYLGVMQLVIEKVSFVMQLLMGTTAGESLNAAGNIFVGMTEAPLLIRPFIGKMTNSELHAVMTGGFATIAGSVMGAYIKFGVPANHLISASVMSAPAALAISKLFYPETKKTKTSAQQAAKMEKSPYQNLIEAATSGALVSIRLVANIAASLIAFLAVLEFVNQTLTWFGNRAGMTQNLTFQLICSYLLWPLALLMGVAVPDCRRVAELIGMKTFLNEYIGYTQLATLIKNKVAYDKLMTAMNVTSLPFKEINNDFVIPALNTTYVGGFFMSRRSEVIATYSLCGFANIGSIGILLGGLSGLAPHRTRDMAGFVTRAMIAGNVACFLTACIAGLFYDPQL